MGKTGNRRVDAVENAAMAGQERAAVLDAGAALDERFEQVADDAHRDQEDDDQRHADVAEAIDDDRVEAFAGGLGDVVDREPGRGDEERAGHAAPHALPALAGTDRRRELALAERPAAEIGEDVGRPDEEKMPRG